MAQQNTSRNRAGASSRATMDNFKPILSSNGVQTGLLALALMLMIKKVDPIFHFLKHFTLTYLPAYV
jgi:hypothetical protein